MTDSSPSLLSIRAAARAAGVSERTIRRRIATGAVSATVDAHGQLRVDAAELLRVGMLTNVPQANTANAPGGPQAAEDSLRARAEAAEARCRELEVDRDAWRSQAEGLMRALTAAPVSGTGQAPDSPIPPKRPWWRRRIR